MNILFGEKLRWPLAIMALPQVFIFVVLQLLRNASPLMPEAYQGFFLFQAMFLAAVGLVLFFKSSPNRLLPLLESPVAAFALGLGSAMILGAIYLNNVVLLAVGAILSACAQGLMYLQCFLCFAHLPVRARIAFIMLGFALTPPVRMVLVFLPEAIRCVVVLLMPLVCTWFYRREMANDTVITRKDIVGDKGEANAPSSEISPSWKSSFGAETRRFMPYVLIIALFSFGLGYFHAPFDSGVIGEAAYLSAYLKAFILLGILALVLSFQQRIAIDHLCQIALLISVIALAIAVQFDSSQTHIVVAITADLAWYVIVCLLFAMLADLVDKVDIPPLLLFVLGWTPYLLLKVAGNVCANLLQLPTSGSGFLVLVILCAIGGGILVFANIQRDDDSLLFGSADETVVNSPNTGANASAESLCAAPTASSKAPSATFADLESFSSASTEVAPVPETRSSLESLKPSAFEMLAHQYVLTEREREVMELIYEGYSKKAIADKLIISQNTVRTHARTLYAKLDIHSF